MVDRLPVVLRTDTTPARLQEMPAGDLLTVDVLSNALAVVLQGLLTNTSTAVTAADTVLQALGKLQAQVTLRAPLASPALTGTPTVPTATDGTSTTQAASTAFVQGAVGGALSKAVTGGTVTLTAAEASNALITLTGVLTSNLTVVFPAGVRRLWTVMNSTTGSFTVTVKLAAGTGTTVTQGKKNLVTTDGTNFYDALDDFHDINIGGNPTTTTQNSADNSTRLATTAFAQTAATAAKDRANHTGPLNWAWAIYGGTANAVTLAPVFARTAYTTGDEFRFRATATNTGAATINVGGLGAKTAVTVTGAALPAGYIRTDVDTVCVYDGTRFVVQREIEQGTNANGSYVRFANGLQLCTVAFSATPNNVVGSVYRSASILWTFPAAFASGKVPAVSGQEASGNGLCWLGLGFGATDSVSTSFSLFSGISTSVASTVAASALGYWI